MYILTQSLQVSSVFDSLGGILGLVFVFVLIKSILRHAVGKPKNKYPSRSTHPHRYPNPGIRPTKRPAFFPGKREIENFNPDNVRVFGVPGKGLQDASGFSERSIKSGVAGEAKTAETINAFAEQSTNCYVFHSLMWPLSSTEADVDHIIVCGDNILLLDSKNWTKKGLYSFDWDGNIALDGNRYFYGRNPKVIVARDKYEEYVRQLFRHNYTGSINSVVVIQNEYSTADIKSYSRYNHLSTGDTLEGFLRDWELSLGIVEDNRKLLCAMHSLLK